MSVLTIGGILLCIYFAALIGACMDTEHQRAVHRAVAQERRTRNEETIRRQHYAHSGGRIADQAEAL
jgi:hypothetical protein